MGYEMVLRTQFAFHSPLHLLLQWRIADLQLKSISAEIVIGALKLATLSNFRILLSMFYAGSTYGPFGPGSRHREDASE